MKKGALVQLVAGFDATIPNVVIFQFNPETMQHSWSQGMGAATAGGVNAPAGANPYAVSGMPSETFSFSLFMDVADQLTDPDPAVQRDARLHGIYARLAALELFLHPTPRSDLLGAGSDDRATPAALLPTVLFVWGATRIVPVRVTSLVIIEQLYDVDLNPTHAEARIELRALSADDLQSVTGVTGELATAAYRYSMGARLALAASNLGTSGRALIGMVVDQIKHPAP